MTKKSVLIFDFDGTIADSQKLEHATLLSTIHEYGFENITEDNLQDYFGPTEDGILKNILGEELFIEAYPLFIEDYIRLQSDYLKRIDGIDELLSKLAARKDLLLLLVTGRSKATADISLAYLGYDQYFAKVYAGSQDGINKDENIAQLLDDYGLKKEDIVYIGDTIADIKTMRAIDVDILSVAYSTFDKKHQDKFEQLNPHNVCYTVKELEEKLLEITA